MQERHLLGQNFVESSLQIDAHNSGVLDANGSYAQDSEGAFEQN